MHLLLNALFGPRYTYSEAHCHAPRYTYSEAHSHVPRYISHTAVPRGIPTPKRSVVPPRYALLLTLRCASRTVTLRPLCPYAEVLYNPILIDPYVELLSNHELNIHFVSSASRTALIPWLSFIKFWSPMCNCCQTQGLRTCGPNRIALY